MIQQIEVPMHSCSKVPSDWTSKSQKKTHRRFWTPFINEKLGQLTAAEEKLAAAQKDTLRYVFFFSLFFLRTTTEISSFTDLCIFLQVVSVRSSLNPSRIVWPR